jgi:DsbC/DsbD-like thiol-disulfide interchange protein
MRLFPAFLGCLFVLSAEAETEGLKAKLISEVSCAVPGQTFYVGLHLTHPAGTHTYWKFPGIVGLATQIDWSPLEGVEIGAIQWPAPQKVMMSRYATQGYEGETLLICAVTVPATFLEKSLVLNAKVSWMHCGKICQPTSDRPISITVPIGLQAISDPFTSPIFEQARASFPVQDDLWRSSVKREGNEILLTLKSNDPTQTRAVADLKDLRFFTLDGQVDSSEPQKSEVLADGTLLMRLRVSETAPQSPPDLPGVLTVSNGWRADGTSHAITLRPTY